MSTITLPNIRVGSDLQVRVRLKDGGVAIDWSTLQSIKACIYSDAQRALAGRCGFSIDEEDSTLLVCTYAANKPQYLGVNRIVISAKYMGETKTYDKPAFNFVRWTADQEGEEITIDDPDVDVEIDVEDISSSILQEAVDAAFEAADRANDAAAAAEHMVDIHTGPEGKSAYEVAVEEGYTGTEEEWLASLVGPQGQQGIQGETGEAAGFGTVSVSLQEDGGQPSATVAASGTDTAKNFAFTFNNLKGEKGDKGDQGNSGYTGAAGELEVVNNLTDGGSTAALSAEMGKTLEGEVSQLEAKVDGVEWRNAETTITNNYYVYAKNNANLGTQVFSASYKRSDYVDLQGASKVRISVCTDTSDGKDKGCVFYDESKTALSGYVFESDSDTNDVHELDVPANAKYIRTTMLVNVSGDFVCQLLLQGESLQEQITENANNISELQGQISRIDQIDADVMSQDRTSIVAVDLMQLVHALNLLSSTDYMSVVSSTETSITLSSSDVAKFPASPKYGAVAVVGFTDGTYKTVYFGAPSGNSIPRASFDDTDLTDAATVQSLHDTVSGGNGQHLSPSGYIAMGKFVADELLKQTSLIDKNWIGGLVFTRLALAKGYQNTDENNAVYDMNDNLVCTPVYNNWMWGGYTPNGNNTANTRGVGNAGSNYNCANGWSTKAFRIVQGKKDAYIEFPIRISGTGFVEIQAAKIAEKATSTGDCQMSLYVDGVLVGTQTLVMNQHKYIFQNIKINSEMRVRFTLLENADTDVAIYSIGFWKMYPSVPVPVVDSITKIAVLGDSWSQFPMSGNGLLDHPSWNDIVTRPDNTQGNGYGYFPKALAQYTGAIVDNWGKSDMRADNWGLVMIDEILEHARYDYLIVEFFINDYNHAGTSMANWIANIKRICDKCKPFGTRPVFVMPCGTNSSWQVAGLGEWHEAVVQGLGAV